MKAKTGRVLLYLSLMLISALTFAGIVYFNGDGVGAFLLTMLCIYVFLGSVIKLCMMKERWRDSAVFFLDLLFFLP